LAFVNFENFYSQGRRWPECRFSGGCRSVPLGIYPPIPLRNNFGQPQEKYPRFEFFAKRILVIICHHFIDLGKVVNTKHSVPTGDWFDVVSSPHLLAEIMMYICLTVLLWPNSCWLLILYWVLANQV
jgi:3-oxo-5-alpha-steroid 4-dehydrogenase